VDKRVESSRSQSKSIARTPTGYGILAFIPLPFVGFVGFLVWKLLPIVTPELYWPVGLFLLFFAAAVAGTTIRAFTLVRRSNRVLEEQEELEARYPTEPWLRDKDWASGRMEDGSSVERSGSWGFALLWNLVTIPLCYVFFRVALHQEPRLLLIIVVFPLIGVALLIGAIRTSLRGKKYGVTRLELSTIPGVIGHTFAGTVRVNGLLQVPDGFQVTLNCLRRVTTRTRRRRGSHNSVSETILWHEELRIRGEPTRDAEGMGTRIPIAFRLPADARPCDFSDPDDQIRWRLELSADVPGVDYESTFDVPVFRTAASDSPLSQEEERRTQQQVVTADYRPPAGSRIVVTAKGKGTEILFPSARNSGAAKGATLLTLFWAAAIGLLVYSKTPLWFPIVLGIIGLLPLSITLDLWFAVSRVIAQPGTVVIATGYLTPGRGRVLSAGEISDVTTGVGMQAGSNFYYDVVILRKDGKKESAGRLVRDKREAECLALTIKTALGLEAVAPTPVLRAS
jgi:hypothetical protein